MKISFDFDATLDQQEMQELATRFLQSGFEVHITTSRADFKDGLRFENKDLFEVSDAIGIDRKNIKFTSYADKYLFVKDFSMHFDDNEDEIDLINKFPGKCIGFLYQPRYNNGSVNF